MADPLHRQVGPDLLDAPRRLDLGVDDAGAYRVDANTFRGDLLRQAPIERIDGAFRGRIGHVYAGAAKVRGCRRHVDDRAAGAAMDRRHAPDSLAAADQHGRDIELPERRQIFGLQFVDAAIGADDAGAVYQVGYRAELLVDGLEQAHHVGFPADVGLNGDCLGAGLLARGDDLVGARFVADVIDADRFVALFGGADTGGGAEAAAAPGNDENFRHI